MRTALWMQNDEKSCSTPGVTEYGELDLLEHYTASIGYDGMPRWAYIPANTHVGCGDRRNHRAERDLFFPNTALGQDVTYTVKTSEDSVAYSVTTPSGSTFKVDRPSGKRKADAIADAGPDSMGSLGRDSVDPALFRNVLARPWTFTLNQYVTTFDWQGLPDDSAPFPTVRLLVDRVDVEGTPFERVDVDPGSEGSASDVSSKPGSSAGSAGGFVGVVLALAGLVGVAGWLLGQAVRLGLVPQQVVDALPVGLRG
ncbi:hypothetical protein CAQU_12240 [Corynebacterium aquilae DSM 44791]|uniref:Uncharacterized protein n=1 Tax=Corynebacterium aquilae DSM 44791 TaxID=1431546 RepID=A0A1L7CIP3_9CORY|nr:hypothetical protein CAQU_12240 [Corynebacterium aquilae DSM 44791]